MEQTYLFVQQKDDNFNKMKEGNGIDNVIKAVTEVGRRLSEERDTTPENDVVNEPEAVGMRSLVCTGDDEVCPKSKYVVQDAGDQTDWYEIAVREGIKVITRYCSDAEASFFVIWTKMAADWP